MERRKFFKRILSTSLLASPVISALAKADLTSPVDVPDNDCTQISAWVESPSHHYEGRTHPGFSEHITGWVVEFNPNRHDEALRF